MNPAGSGEFTRCATHQLGDGYNMRMRPDHVLDIDARHARVATWGTPPNAAFSLANRIAREYTRSTGIAEPSFVPARAPGRELQLPETRATGALIDRLGRIAPTRSDDIARRALSLGKSYPDLVAARGERLDRATDVVVRPRTQAELEQVMALLAEENVAVVPVGGGTSVVGGIEPLGAHDDQPVVSIDLGSLSRTVDVDPISNVATFEAGIRGPRVEASLAPHGLTLGHVPQSFELATLGGWVATRSAGQGSLRFGKIESMVAGARLVTPTGVIDIDHLPAHGAGIDMREMVMGSEGTFGIISQATMRITSRPTHIRFATYLHPDFPTAARAARTLVQAGIRPTMVRVSDTAETAFSLGGSIPTWLRSSMMRRAVRSAGLGDAAMTIVLTTGTQDEVRLIERTVDRHMRASGAWNLGPVPAHHWYRARFVQPYARDLMMDRGMLVDTLETAMPWRSLPEVHRDVRAALESTLGVDRTIVGCHLSHLYRDGASAYFTFITRVQSGLELRAWRAAKRAVHEVLSSHHAAVSHQHGVGTMHADLYRRATPHHMIDAMQAVRTTFDPNGVMNPGKLFGSSALVRPVNSCVER